LSFTIRAAHLNTGEGPKTDCRRGSRLSHRYNHRSVPREVPPDLLRADVLRPSSGAAPRLASFRDGAVDLCFGSRFTAPGLSGCALNLCREKALGPRCERDFRFRIRRLLARIRGEVGGKNSSGLAVLSKGCSRCALRERVERCDDSRRARLKPFKCRCQDDARSVSWQLRLSDTPFRDRDDREQSATSQHAQIYRDCRGHRRRSALGAYCASATTSGCGRRPRLRSGERRESPETT
jgi:hypothetical protein